MEIKTDQARILIPEGVQRYIEGDHQTYIKLLFCSNFQQKLRKIAHKYSIGNTLDWQDIYQSAQLKIIEAVNKGKFNNQLGDFSYWALTIGKYYILDLIYQENRKNTVSLDKKNYGTDLSVLDTITEGFSILDSLEKAELISKLLQSIQTLESRYPQKEYSKLWEAKLAGKTQQEIAIEMNITQSAVSKRWKQFVALLTHTLELSLEHLY